MTNVIIALGLLVSLASMVFYRTWQARKDGRTEEKLDNAESVLKQQKKGDDAVARARGDDDLRERLRNRYDIK